MELLRDRIKKWRECSEKKLGKVYLLYMSTVLGVFRPGRFD